MPTVLLILTEDSQMPFDRTRSNLVKRLTVAAFYSLTHDIQDIFWVRRLRCNRHRRKRLVGLLLPRKAGLFIYLDDSQSVDEAAKTLFHEVTHSFLHRFDDGDESRIEEELVLAIEDFVWEHLSQKERELFYRYLPSRIHYSKQPR